ncbi:hypothetical protein PENTCL1PPCAC_28069 [Pristionchus entomophagus]|uniref:Uncharacterized protein n=1 Tax=Pristionchus entomophagus TaxID=358040 RepID=A0AAV5UJ58_9BILA|nr:hypothetical protein PENTCL1PPCAC_28069 [Pristionchus entomophagus]
MGTNLVRQGEKGDLWSLQGGSDDVVILELGGVVLLELFSVVSGLRSDEGVVVSDDLLGGELAVLVVIGGGDEVLGLGVGVVESDGHDPVAHLVLIELSVGVLVSVLLEHLALGLHPVGFLAVELGVVVGPVHVSDVLLEIDETVLVLVDILNSLGDDDISHVIAVLGVHEASILGPVHLAVGVVVGCGPSLLVSGDHLGVIGRQLLSGTIGRSVDHLAVVLPSDLAIDDLLGLVILPRALDVVVDVTLLHEVDVVLELVLLDESVSVRVHLGHEFAQLLLGLLGSELVELGGLILPEEGVMVEFGVVLVTLIVVLVGQGVSVLLGQGDRNSAEEDDQQ